VLHTWRQADELIEGFLEKQSLASIASVPLRGDLVRPQA
jgi:hypothetical protein